jgi:hypothetical protein
MSWIPWAKSPATKVTTYQQGKPVAFESLPKKVQQPPPLTPPNQPDVLTLTSSQPAKGQLLSKDASLNPTWMHMAYRKEDPVSLDFVTQMAEVGKVEGFHVVAHVMTDELSQFQKGLPKEASANVTVTQNSGKHDAWSEDQGEFTSQGELIVPAIVSKDTEFDRISVRGRQKRYFALPEQGLPQLGCNFASMGLTNAHDGQLALLSSAQASGSQSLHVAKSYVEGGNLFTGLRADGSPYALVGKDSVAITSAILKCDEDQAAEQIAIDYNLAPEQLVSIEQPGSFHLDMSMAPGKPGQILLNDARQVANLQKEWLTDHFAKSWFSKEDPEQAFQAVDKAMAKVALHEDQAERELRQAGFEVIRVAGNFPESPANPPMNFLNLRQGSNDDGQRFAVSLGGTPQAEAAFVAGLESKMPGHFYRIHFLDRSLTSQTLQYKGGVKCRTKPRV